MRQQYHFRKVENDTHIWNVNKLMKKLKNIPVEVLPVHTFRDQLNTDYWAQGKSMTCDEVIAHTQLILEADLSFPILLCPEYKVIDGMHRICKAVLEKRKIIEAIVLKTLPPPDHVNIDPNDLSYITS